MFLVLTKMFTILLPISSPNPIAGINQCKMLLLFIVVNLVSSVNIYAHGLEKDVEIIVIDNTQDIFARKDTQVTKPECNVIDPEYYHTDNRVTFVTKPDAKKPEKQIWITHINPVTGIFQGECAREIFVDRQEVSIKPLSSPLGNGPEWGNKESSIFYMKQDVTKTSHIAHAVSINKSKWKISKLPNSDNKLLPIPSNNSEDEDEKILYLKNNNDGNFTLAWRSVSADQDNLIPVLVSINNGLARWVPNKHQISFTMIDENGKTQAALYDIDGNVIDRVSTYTGSEVVDEVWSLNVPEFGGEQIVWCTVDAKEIHVYKKIDDHWNLVRKILLSNQDYSYILSPEPVIFNNKTYLFFQQSMNSNQDDPANYSQVCIVELLGNLYRMLTDPNKMTISHDPEWVIRKNQMGKNYLFIYYTKIDNLEKYKLHSIRSVRTGLHD